MFILFHTDYEENNRSIRLLFSIIFSFSSPDGRPILPGF